MQIAPRISIPGQRHPLGPSRDSKIVRFVPKCPQPGEAVLFCKAQPLGKYLSFLEASIAFEGMGRPRGFRRFRKTHLENILPRGSQNRDPKYPKRWFHGTNFFKKNFSRKVICVYVHCTGFGGYYG